MRRTRAHACAIAAIDRIAGSKVDGLIPVARRLSGRRRSGERVDERIDEITRGMTEL